MSEFNEAMLLQQRFMLLQAIINVTDKEHDVAMQKVTSPTDIYDWCCMKVQGQGSKSIQALVTKDTNGDLVYPNLEQMRDALLKTYKLEKDPNNIINEIKFMKINKGDDVKEFNQKYLNLYNDLSDEYNNHLANNNNHNNSNFNNKHKDSFCKFCHEKGHSISDYSGYAKFQYYK
ncbi:hypothetical protein U3516DRAFT_791436 [Neocallimastix sp. 'constans']